MKKNILFLMIIAFISSCSREQENINNNDKTSINKAFLQNVKTIKAVVESEKEDMILTGKVEYDPDKVINYVPLINGVVVKTDFSLGDKVKKGQLLAVVRSMKVSSLQSEKSSLESELKVVKREFKSAQSMYQDNMVSERELIEAQAKVKQAEAALGRVKTDMSVIGSGHSGGSFSILSPITGYIVAKSITSGSTLSPDANPIFKVADLSEVWITANVYASNLLFVKEGMPVEISTLSYPGEVFIGKIHALSQVFDPEEKVLKARIVMPNPDLKFKPEMSMLIKLKNNTDNLCVSIPVNALIFDNDRHFVVVEETKHNFSIKEVKLKGHNEEIAYILSGLSEGENVVIKNQLLIYSGLKNE